MLRIVKKLVKMLEDTPTHDGLQTLNVMEAIATIEKQQEEIAELKQKLVIQMSKSYTSPVLPNKFG